MNTTDAPVTIPLPVAGPAPEGAPVADPAPPLFGAFLDDSTAPGSFPGFPLNDSVKPDPALATRLADSSSGEL